MNRFRLFSVALAVLVTAATTVPAQEESQEPGFAEQFRGQLKEWLPGMGAEKIGDRRNPQQALQEALFALGGGAHKEDLSTACAIVAEKIGPKTAKPTRVWLIRQLEFNGGPECVDAVAACLKDKDAAIRDCARLALQNNPAPAAGAKLLEGLTSAVDDAQRAALCNALGCRGDAASVPALAKLLSQRKENVVAAAANALGRIGNAEAAKALSGALTGASEKLKGPLADAYLRCADKMLAAGKKSEAQAIYKKLAGDDWPRAIRLAAMQGMLKAAGTKP